MPRISLTIPLVKGTKCPIGKAKYDLFDTFCKGLLLEIRSSGNKTYYLRYTDSRGKIRQFKLADERDVSLLQARSLSDNRYECLIFCGAIMQKKQDWACKTTSQITHS